MSVRLIPGDCIRAMRLMAALGIQVDSIVCDPPYHLTSIVKRFGAEGAAEVKAGKAGAYKRASAGFMGKGRHALSLKARNKEGAGHGDLPLFKESAE